MLMLMLMLMLVLVLGAVCLFFTYRVQSTEYRVVWKPYLPYLPELDMPFLFLFYASLTT